MELQIKPMGKIKCSIKRHGTHATLNRFVHPQGIATLHDVAALSGVSAGDILRVIEAVKERMKGGYEVRLGKDKENCIRLYFLLSKDCRHVEAYASTMGTMRTFISKAKTEIYHGGKELADDEVSEMVQSQRAKHEVVAVTPDKMVTCPKCGFEFRVGKRLT